MSLKKKKITGSEEIAHGVYIFFFFFFLEFTSLIGQSH